MAIKLDDISLAIGELRSGQAAAERSRTDHSQRVEAQFDDVARTLRDLNTKVDELKTSLDGKVEAAISKSMIGIVGGTGGIVAIVGQYLASHLGFKF